MPKLPEPPEGHFWRVRQGALSLTYLELRKKTFFGSKKVDSRICRYYDLEHRVIDPEYEIARRAESILAEYYDPWDEYYGEYYGEYPPKTFRGDENG